MQRVHSRRSEGSEAEVDGLGNFTICSFDNTSFVQTCQSPRVKNLEVDSNKPGDYAKELEIV